MMLKMMKSYRVVGWWVAHKILVTAQVLGFDWVGAGPWGFGIWDGA